MIHFQVLGTIGLAGHDGTEARAVLSQPKRIGLLLYLALAEPFGFHRRDTLLALFWPDMGDEEARRALRQALHFLRQHLGQETIENRGLDEVGLSREALSCDAWDFRAEVGRGEPEAALTRYQGAPLTGFHVGGVSPEFESWLEDRRSELRRLALLAARQGIQHAAREGRTDDVERWARMAAEHEEAEDDDVLCLMRILQASRQDAAALNAYTRHAARVQDRFATEPGLAVRELAADIRNGITRAGVPVTDGLGIPATFDSGTTPAPAVSSRKSQFPLALIGGFLIVVMAFAAWRFAGREPEAEPPPPGAGPIVAVAVLTNRTTDSTLEPLGIVAAEWITRGLARVPNIQVLDVNALYTRGRTASGEAVDPMTLARLSKSAWVVGGAYYRVGPDSIRFAAEVLDGSNGRIVRSVDHVFGSREDPLRAVDDLGNRLASAIHSIFDPRAIMIDAPAQSPPRYDAFVEFVLGQEAFWGLEFGKALEHTLRAARLDTSFVMASIFATTVAVSNSQCGLVDSITTALGQRSDRINEFERTTLALSRVRCQRNWPEGVKLQRRRLELQPNSVVIRYTAAQTYALANRPGEAVEIYRGIDRQREVAWMLPRGRSGLFSRMGSAYHQLGDFAGERQVADDFAATNDDALLAIYLHARSAAGLGDTVGVIAALAALPPMNSRPVPASAIADDQIYTWLPTPEYVLAQVAAELAGHGYPAVGKALALRSIEESRAEPASTIDQFARGLLLLVAGKTVDAQAVFARLVSENPESMRLRGILGALAARNGDRTVAAEEREWLLARNAPVPPGLPVYYAAAIAANTGEPDRALDLIEALPYGAHPQEFYEFHVDPLLAPLWGEPRFQRFIKPR